MSDKVSIALAADHAGFELKETIVAMLNEMGYEIHDLGTGSTDSVDYPDYVHPLAQSIESGESEMGILMCGTGNGVAMTANKHEGIRAALCWNEELAALARQHNNANVVALPARFIDPELGKKIVRAFITTTFEGGRHAGRVNKIPVAG